jgi:hypothetical protein
MPVFSVYQIMFGSQKCQHLKVACSFTTLVFGLSSDENLLLILIHNSYRFSDICRISTWWEHHDQKFESRLPPAVMQLDPHSILDCIVIAAQFFFTHPPLPEVWPYSQNFWSQSFHFLTPHILISRVMKTAMLWLLEGITVGFTFFPSFVALDSRVSQISTIASCTFANLWFLFFFSANDSQMRKCAIASKFTNLENPCKP